MYKNSSIRKIY